MFNIRTSYHEILRLFKGNPESLHEAGTFALIYKGLKVSKQLH